MTTESASPDGTSNKGPEEIHHTPQEAGLYFAKSRRAFKWWNLVIQVSGEAPFLYIDKVLRRDRDHGSPDDKALVVWGPKVVVPGEEGE